MTGEIVQITISVLGVLLATRLILALALLPSTVSVSALCTGA